MHVVDGLVGGPVEVVGPQDLDDVGDGVLAQQHAAEHRLLGGEVLRGLPVERARLGALARTVTARRAPVAGPLHDRLSRHTQRHPRSPVYRTCVRRAFPGRPPVTRPGSGRRRVTGAQPLRGEVRRHLDSGSKQACAEPVDSLGMDRDDAQQRPGTACGQSGDNCSITRVSAAQRCGSSCGQDWGSDTPERSRFSACRPGTGLHTARPQVRSATATQPDDPVPAGATSGPARGTRKETGAGSADARPAPHAGDCQRQPATTATSSSVVTSGCRRTVTGCLPTVLIWLGTSTARRSSAGPPAARTASTTSDGRDRAEQPARVARGLRRDGDVRGCPAGRRPRGRARGRGSRGTCGPADRVDLLLRAPGGHDRPARAGAGSCGRSRP